jgi:hypothetical protein
MPTQDEEIARHLSAALASGELRAAPSFGKPLAHDAGWDATPEELRMPFKILKDAGFAPPEVALFHERARLTQEIAQAADPGQRRKLQQQLAEMEQKIALRLEALRLRRSL